MIFCIRHPGEIEPGTVVKDLVINCDFPALFLDLAGQPVPGSYQGRSFRANLRGKTPDDWRTTLYYRYWSHAPLRPAHRGVRDSRYKLIHFYGNQREW